MRSFARSISVRVCVSAPLCISKSIMGQTGNKQFLTVRSEVGEIGAHKSESPITTKGYSRPDPMMGDGKGTVEGHSVLLHRECHWAA